jgi:hypothetical protein
MSSHPSDHTVTLHRVSTFCTGAVISSLSRELSWERRKVKKWRDERIKLAVSDYFEYSFGCILSKSGRETDQPWKFSLCTVLMYELRMCSRSFLGTTIFAAWEKIFHLDYQQRYFV